MPLSSDFERELEGEITRMRRGVRIALLLSVFWVAFLVGTVGTVVWMAGRYLAVW